MYKLLVNLVSFGLLMAVLLFAGIFVWFKTAGFDIPDYTKLATYEPPVTTRLYAGDGQVLMEYVIMLALCTVLTLAFIALFRGASKNGRRLIDLVSFDLP